MVFKGLELIGVCSIPKLLHKSKLVETFRKLADGKTVYQARKIANVSVRRVYGILSKIRVHSKFVQVSARIILHNKARLSYFNKIK